MVATGSQSRTVTVIDALTRTVDAVIPVGPFPMGLGVSLDGQRLYVSLQGADAIGVLDAGTLKVRRRLPLGGRPSAWPSRPTDCAAMPRRGTWITCCRSTLGWSRHRCRQVRRPWPRIRTDGACTLPPPATTRWPLSVRANGRSTPALARTPSG
ncbi:YncE family protein [Streptomyces iakyrus]|uniref:YncE family protein n=1 Tax=Streptomyces iakyrus TaxID=68219 RepID=UPI0037FBD74D